MPPSILPTELSHFIRDNLGPASAQCAAKPEFVAEFEKELQGGLDQQDAALRVFHRHAIAGNSLLASEFLEYFLTKVLRLARRSMSSGLRGLLDTEDLLQSVLTDLWPDFASVEFRSRASFVSLLAQRLKWKAMDHAKRRTRKRRREDLKTGLPDGDAVADRSSPPLEELIGKEELAQLYLALFRLPETERRVLTLFLRGETISSIAAELKVSPSKAGRLLDDAKAGAGRMMREQEVG